MSDTVLYYLDTNAFFKFYFSPDEISKAQIRTLATDGATLCISNLTYLEFLGMLMRKYRNNELRKKTLGKIVAQLEEDVGTERRFHIIPVQEDIFSEARRLMLRYGGDYALGTNDALHIVMAKTFSPEMIMVTSDGGKSDGKMKGVCRELGLNIFDPEQPINIAE
ncbi:MAG: hypothetical protein RL368_1899 [Pseudomonadota bacterium]|jgi:predicted nucleic acid-binding protein